MKTLLVGRFDLKYGGPSHVVNNLKKKIKDDKDYEIQTLNITEYNVFIFISKILFSKKFKNYLFQFNLIHFHELWHPSIIFLSLRAQHLGIPYFFTFHGVLNKWSMNKNNLQKKIFLFFFSRFILNITQAFHFLNYVEFKEARSVTKKFDFRSFVLSNGVDLSKINSVRKKLKKDYLQILFFGRKHPKKGILDLIDAFKIIKSKGLKIKLNIVGPKNDYENFLFSKVKDYGLEDFISFKDGIFDDKGKIELFSESDYFILPSYDEADSIAIKEAVSFGVPVVITKECKFVIPEKYNLGFTISHDANEIFQVIEKLKVNDQKYEEMSLACSNYAKLNFDLRITVEKYKEITREIVTGVKYSDNWL